MTSRRPANIALKPLFNMLEQRFSLHLDCSSASHLRDVCELYDAKRALLLRQHGASGVLVNEDYAKAVLISETARLALREIDPWPRRNKPKKGKPT